MEKYRVWYWFDGERENAVYRTAKSGRDILDILQDLSEEFGEDGYDCDIETVKR